MYLQNLLLLLLFEFEIYSAENQRIAFDFEKKDDEKLPQQNEILILISFDGFRWDYLRHYNLPNFKQYFLDQGAKVSGGLLNTFTTVTFPNHWTIATGLYAESHGMVANSMYDSDLNETFAAFTSKDNSTKWFGQNEKAMPIWILNELNGKQSGIIGRFPGANVPIKNRTISNSADYSNQLSWYKRVNILIDWILNKQDFNFGVLYFDEPDDIGHVYGPFSKELEAILYKCDAIVGYLINKLKEAKLFERTNIIITSDHGMDSVSLNKSIDLIDYVDVSKFKTFGGLSYINIFPINEKDEEDIYNALKKIPNYHVYKKSEMLSRLHYMNNIRIGKIVMYGKVGHEIFRANRAKFDWSRWKGDHGGDNRASSMRPLLVARGPAFKENFSTPRHVEIQSVDVYSLMCFILNLTSSDTNGTLVQIKTLLKDDYYNSNSNRAELDSFFYLKSFFQASFKYESLVEEFNFFKTLNQYGHLYIVFLIFFLIFFILIVHNWSTNRRNESIIYDTNNANADNIKYIEIS